jgi:hypothetical protein
LGKNKCPSFVYSARRPSMQGLPVGRSWNGTSLPNFLWRKFSLRKLFQLLGMWSHQWSRSNEHSLPVERMKSIDNETVIKLSKFISFCFEKRSKCLETMNATDSMSYYHKTFCICNYLYQLISNTCMWSHANKVICYCYYFL